MNHEPCGQGFIISHCIQTVSDHGGWAGIQYLVFRHGLPPTRYYRINSEGRLDLSNRGRFGKYGEIKRRERLALSVRGPAKPPGLCRGERSRQNRASTRGIHFKLRQGFSADRVFVRTLSRKVFSAYGPYDEILGQWFDAEACLSFVALKRGSRAGFILVGDPRGLTSETDVEVLAIAVEPALHRSGVGSALLKRAEQTLRTLGFRSLLLHTAVENSQAIGFFKSQGFFPIESKTRFYPLGQDAFTMKKTLF